MSLAVESCITREEHFLKETFTDDEWFRHYKPGTNVPYQTFDHITNRSGHFGYDLHDDYGAPVFAGVHGVTRWVDNGPALGRQIEVIDDVTGLRLVSNHLSWRTSSGLKVTPDTVVGHIGNSGGVPTHLHYTCYDDRGYGYFHNPGAALESCKESYMPLNDADKAWIRDTVREMCSRAAFTLLNGRHDDKLWGPSPYSTEATEALTHNLKAIDAKA